MQKNKLWIIVIAILIAIIGLIFWLSPSKQQTVDSTAQSLPQQQPNAAALSTPSPLKLPQSSHFMSKSQQDTEINCQLQLDASNRLIVNEQTRNCFEYFITQFGEKSLDQIRADFVAYISETQKEPALSQMIDLWHRYLDYRQQLGSIQPPTGLDQEDPKYYRAIFNMTNDLRKKIFSAYEIEGLFGPEDTYHIYTIDRMEVLADTKLTEKEKAAKLKELFNQLPQDWQENLEQINKLEDLRKLTSDIKKRGGNAEEIRQMRLNLVGAEATQRLEVLDVQRSDWKSKVTGYLGARDDIMQSSMSDSAKTEAIQQLRHKHFNNQQDQLRVETFEAVHDKGGKLPFSE